MIYPVSALLLVDWWTRPSLYLRCYWWTGGQDLACICAAIGGLVGKVYPISVLLLVDWWARFSLHLCCYWWTGGQGLACIYAAALLLLVD